MKTKTLINVIPYEDDTHYKRVTYEQVKKACGKRSGGKCGGERLAHGPYWYRAEWEPDGRKKENAFLHQKIARLEAELAEARVRAPRADLSGAVKLERASKVYRKLAAKYHPDHNSATAEVMRDLNELWQMLKSV